jgi:LEA14-like dessication related protein
MRIQSVLNPAFVLLAAMTLFGCANPIKSPSASIEDVRLLELDPEAANVIVVLKVSNPNGVEVSVSNIKAAFFLAGQEVATVQALQNKYTLPARGSLSIPMRARVPLKTLPEAVRRSAIALMRFDLPYRISGSVDVVNGLVTVPFEKSGNFAR